MGEHPQNQRLGDEVLTAVNDAIVALHERYHGRKPVTARTQMLGDDLLACMLGDIYTNVEKTLIELQRQALVHETRSAFQQAMEQRFIATVERITERRVARFISTTHVGPDLELELFVLETDHLPVRRTGFWGTLPVGGRERRGPPAPRDGQRRADFHV